MRTTNPKLNQPIKKPQGVTADPMIRPGPKPSPAQINPVRPIGGPGPKPMPSPAQINPVRPIGGTGMKKGGMVKKPTGYAKGGMAKKGKK